jgi:transposase InsO family protein
MANGAGHREAGDRHRLAPTGLPALVDVEESTPARPTVGARRHPHRDSHDGGGEPALGRAADPWRIAETRIDICQATVAKYMGHRRQPPSQTWRTFLTNHVGRIVPADFFVVPTVTFRLVFVLVLLAHDRRRIRHVAVTAHPTAAWTAQQLRDACPWDEAPRYLLHDRDHAFAGLGATTKAMGIEDVLTAPHAPWQNPFVERFVGSARRECFDHVLAFNEAGVRKLMALYGSYYENARTHLALGKDAPIPRPVMPPGNGAIVAIPEVGGLHHRYERRAA